MEPLKNRTSPEDVREHISRMLAVKLAGNCLETLRVHRPQLGELNGTRTTPMTDEYVGWMCQKIIEHCADWEIDKLHRWVGFVQGVMVDRGYTTIDAERQTVIRIKESQP